MLNIARGLVGSLELAIMECFWETGPQSSRDILDTLRATRTIAHTTITSTLARLHDQGLVTRALIPGYARTWRYTARYTSKGALIAGALSQLCGELGADYGDRAEALAVLVGAPR